jgi:4-carboxymuconolactone decarboxylase
MNPNARKHGNESTEAQDYIDEMDRRGYLLDYHKVMARHDWPVLSAGNDLVRASYLDQRELEPLTKELLFIVSLVVLRADPAQVRSHIRVALGLGSTPRAILEAIEITLPEAGVVIFQHGFDCWAEVVGADGLEPQTRG